MYEINYGEEFANNLKKLSASIRPEILDTIEEQLLHQPTPRNAKQKSIKRYDSALGP